MDIPKEATPDVRRQNNLDVLVEKIRLTISKAGVCQLHRSEISIIWHGNTNLSDEQRRIYLQNFATLHTLLVVIDYGLEYAIFR